MGNSKKKKQSRNVITTKTFLKKKIKVGKKLKKTNVTNSEVTSKALVILEQYNNQTTEPVSQRGLTINDLNRQIGHPALSVRRDAVIGMKQLLTEHGELINSNLHDLISSTCRLFSDEKFACDKICSAHLKALIKTIFSASEKTMASSFELMSSHLRVAFTHTNVHVKKQALEIMILVFDSFPKLARKDTDLYESFLSLMRNTKKPNSKGLLRDAVQKFRLVYESPDADEDVNSFQPPPNGEWTPQTLKALSNRFYFPVFYGSKFALRKTTDTSWLDQFVRS